MNRPASPTVTIKAVGDIIAADQPLCFGFGVRSASPSGLHPVIIPPEVVAVLSGADVLCGNFEAALDDDAVLRFERNTMSAHSTVLRDLKRCGFDVLSVANNHVLERGAPGLARLRDELAVQDISAPGLAGDSVVLERAGVRVGLLSYSMIPDRKNNAQIRVWSAQALGDVAAMRKNCDVLAVNMHWGNEFMEAPSPLQVVTGHALVRAGADIVLGHHPHVLQPVERFERGVIAYSLGNFVTDYYLPSTLDSVVAEFCVSLSPRRITVAFTPATIDPRTHQLHLAEKAAQARILNILTQPVQEMADPDAYNRDVLCRRLWYRRRSIVHVARNLHRYRDTCGFGRWIFTRAVHALTHMRCSFKDPNAVYR